MHKITSTHKTGDARVSMNGGGLRNESFQYGWGRKEGMRVLTGVGATIFATHIKSKKTANKKEQQQTSKKTHKENKNGATKIHSMK